MGESVKPVSTWAPFRIGVFRAMWIAVLLSNIGTWMQAVGWILLVEDNEANQMLARAVLERDGYDIRMATCAEETLGLLKHQRPALLLMDIQLPGQDGLSLTRQLRLTRPPAPFQSSP